MEETRTVDKAFGRIMMMSSDITHKNNSVCAGAVVVTGKKACKADKCQGTVVEKRRLEGQIRLDLRRFKQT